MSAASAVCSAVDSIDARVGGNRVAFLDEHEVAGHELARPGLRLRSPSRMTVASAADIARSAATAASARASWTNPITALSSTTAKIAIASYGSAASRSYNHSRGGYRGRDEQQDDEHVLELREEARARRERAVRLASSLRPSCGETRARFDVAQATV